MDLIIVSVISVIAIVLLSGLLYNSMKQNKELQAFIMAGLNERAYHETREYKIKQFMDEDAKKATETADLSDYHRLILGGTVDDKDIERFGGQEI